MQAIAPVITVYPARDAPGKADSTRFITIVARRRVAANRFSLSIMITTLSVSVILTARPALLMECDGI